MAEEDKTNEADSMEGDPQRQQAQESAEDPPDDQSQAGGRSGRPSRISRPPKDYEPSFHGKSYQLFLQGEKSLQFLQGQAKESETIEYNLREAFVLATIMVEMRDRVAVTKEQFGHQFVVTYSLKQGIKKFGQPGLQSAFKEMKQLHDRECFEPVHKTSLNPVEKSWVMESLIFLTQKRDASIKSRHCANGSMQRRYMGREEVSSPTVSTESTLLTAVIEAHECREVAVCDIPNAFIQTEMERVDKDGHQTIMHVRGVLVDILCQLDPVYKPYVVWEGKQGKQQKVLYLHITG